MLGIPNIIAFLTKHDLDDESKSLSASLLISIGSAAPVYASFAQHHGVFEALCSWGRSTDNERHHFKIQVAACISRCSGHPHALRSSELLASLRPPSFASRRRGQYSAFVVTCMPQRHLSNLFPSLAHSLRCSPCSPPRTSPAKYQHPK